MTIGWLGKSAPDYIKMLMIVTVSFLFNSLPNHAAVLKGERASEEGDRTRAEDIVGVTATGIPLSTARAAAAVANEFGHSVNAGEKSEKQVTAMKKGKKE